MKSIGKQLKKKQFRVNSQILSEVKHEHAYQDEQDLKTHLDGGRTP